jgi:energy-coupling factor transporter ATP-binding protein EcfA2
VRLDATTTLKVGDIASEGEHCCIALAAFLAELSQASHRSALVFDDPVSSLDHKRRAAIAARLIAEAKIRQVLVFTHDLAFVCDLQTCADEQVVEIHGRHLDWSAAAPGRCHDELPWEGQKHKAQMKTLREQCVKAAKIWREEGQKEYRDFARGVCDLIRTAAERIVEEELFNHVLRRHESRIQIGRLESVGAVEAEDYKAVHAVWKACSEVIPGHSSSRAKLPEVPDPTKIKEHVDGLERVVTAVKQRRKGVVAATASMEIAPPGGLPIAKPKTKANVVSVASQSAPNIE